MVVRGGAVPPMVGAVSPLYYNSQPHLPHHLAPHPLPLAGVGRRDGPLPQLAAALIMDKSANRAISRVDDTTAGTADQPNPETGAV